MNFILKSIMDSIDSVSEREDFLDVLFSRHKSATKIVPIIIFGAGALGKEMLYALRRHEIEPACFCDNNAAIHGTVIDEIPVISVAELADRHKQSLIVMALVKHAGEVEKQLYELGFIKDRILRKETDQDAALLAMYAMVGSQTLFVLYKNAAAPDTILQKLHKLEDKIELAYNAYFDEKSKELFVAKLAVFASNMHFALFKRFMLLFSEPIHKFGMLNYEGTPEDYFYFNNDVFSVEPNEIYMDVGAYDGDTIITFLEACERKQIPYKHIYGIEPDPECFDRLERNIRDIPNVSLHQIGFWSESTILEFVTSENAIHDQAGEIAAGGTVKIEAYRLDDFLGHERISLLKMDPSGVVVENVIKGGANVIKNNKPKLAIGIYHSLDEFINVPIFIKSNFPEYKIFLRHNTYHLCDTDLLAVV